MPVFSLYPLQPCSEIKRLPFDPYICWICLEHEFRDALVMDRTTQGVIQDLRAWWAQKPVVNGVQEIHLRGYK